MISQIRRINAKKLSQWKRNEDMRDRSNAGRYSPKHRRDARDMFEFYDSDRDEWLPYTEREDQLLKTAWLKGQPKVTFHSELYQQKYEVDFTYNIQKNLSTGTSRSIRTPVRFGPFKVKKADSENNKKTDGNFNANKKKNVKSKKFDNAEYSILHPRRVQLTTTISGSWSVFVFFQFIMHIYL
jgi:hypothetical protein